MKTAISGQDKDLTSPVACHFGRCCVFHIYDDETGVTELFENCDKEKSECAGESILECLIGKDVKHIVSANFGARVQKEMSDHDIKMTLLTDCSKTVGDIIRHIERKQTIGLNAAKG
jgi:predicted Fe-Mo cluster-binding NifX family protein